MSRSPSSHSRRNHEQPRRASTPAVADGAVRATAVALGLLLRLPLLAARVRRAERVLGAVVARRLPDAAAPGALVAALAAHRAVEARLAAARPTRPPAPPPDGTPVAWLAWVADTAARVVRCLGLRGPLYRADRRLGARAGGPGGLSRADDRQIAAAHQAVEQARAAARHARRARAAAWASAAASARQAAAATAARSTAMALGMRRLAAATAARSTVAAGAAARRAAAAGRRATAAARRVAAAAGRVAAAGGRRLAAAVRAFAGAARRVVAVTAGRLAAAARGFAGAAGRLGAVIGWALAVAALGSVRGVRRAGAWLAATRVARWLARARASRDGDATQPLAHPLAHVPADGDATQPLTQPLAQAPGDGDATQPLTQPLARAPGDGATQASPSNGFDHAAGRPAATASPSVAWPAATAPMPSGLLPDAATSPGRAAGPSARRAARTARRWPSRWWPSRRRPPRRPRHHTRRRLAERLGARLEAMVGRHRLLVAAGRRVGGAVGALANPPRWNRPGWGPLVRPVAAAVALALALGCATALPAGFAMAGSVKAASAGLPDLARIHQLDQPERTEVFDKDGHLIDVLHAEQDRVVIPLWQVSPLLQHAVIAAEDARFYEHHGVDNRGILRAAFVNLLRGETAQGGSTITQQLVRNAYPDLHGRSIVRKVREAALAAQLESRLSKSQILQDYLNRVYFGSGFYGIEAASLGYFHTHARDLDLGQAATLAGIIREPEAANPRDALPEARRLRDVVLDRMVELGMIPAATATATKRQPLRVFEASPEPSGRYPYFMAALKAQLLDDPRLGATRAERVKALFEGGLRIDTTLDPTLQAQAERAAAKWRPAAGPDIALVSIDPSDGSVRALVGGRDFTANHYNLATQALRQPGSSFKPFVLAAAMQAGISPDSTWESSGFATEEKVCGSPWKPQNDEGSASGPITLKEATWRSVNGVYARVMAKLCPAPVAAMAKRLGITRIGSKPGTERLPSIALGAGEVYPIDMASAYATLAAMGTYHKPTLVSRITRHGQLVLDGHGKGEQRIPPELAYEVTKVLEGVITSGTGTAAQLGRPEAGKTGTASNFTNAWFIGYTPQLSTAVWMGDPKGDIPLHDIDGFGDVFGGTIPARVWHDFMADALAGQPPLDWQQPGPGLTFSDQPPPPTTVAGAPPPTTVGTTVTTTNPGPPATHKKKRKKPPRP